MAQKLRALADGSLCPYIQWSFYQYYKVFKTHYGAYYGLPMLEKLQTAVDNYNELCGSKCASVFSEENDLIVVLCSPLMKRVHELWRGSEELVLMDTSGGMDRYNNRVGVLLPPSIVGGLPLGLFITCSETEKMINKSLQMLEDLYPEKAFHGRGKDGPKEFLTDDATDERNSLKFMYHLACLLLCIFHVLQALLRYIK